MAVPEAYGNSTHPNREVNRDNRNRPQFRNLPRNRLSCSYYFRTLTIDKIKIDSFLCKPRDKAAECREKAEEAARMIDLIGNKMVFPL